MKISRSYEKTLKIALFAIGFLLLCFAFYKVWVWYYNPYIRLSFYKRGNFMLTLVYMAVLFICTLVMRGQLVGEGHITEVAVSQCISVLMTNVIFYFPMSLLQYELLNPLPLLILMAGQWALIILWNFIANRIYYKLVPPLRMLFVSDGGGDHEIAAKLAFIKDRYDVCGEISVGAGRAVIAATTAEYDALLISVADDEWRNWLIRLCFTENIQMFMVPTIADIVVNSAKKQHSVDTPLLTSTIHRLTIEERALKRAVDIVGAAVALILTSPLLLVSAVAIKLMDGGPVFFRQERLTRDGKIFRIFKFRSMVVDAEKDGQRLASEHDDRITPVGRVLRKLRIDELPQFLNVLSGEMSLVGPRPEVPSLAAEYEKTLPNFSYRLKVKAGITGYAQVYGNYATDPEDKLLMDIMYIESSGLVLDINLILLTIRTLFMTGKTAGKKDK